MSRPKYSVEEKIKAVERYLRGEASASEIAAEIGMTQNGESYIREWAAIYRENGIEGFQLTRGNRSYSSELKQQAVEDYLQGKGSVRGICRKFKIPSTSMLRSWIKVYNGNRELRDYDPKPEVYVAMARKTTKEERQEIVQYCLEQGKDYKGTATKYNVSYTQVYQWVRKYLESGEAGLSDGRGKRKNDEELDELERLRRENLRLKKKLEESERLNLLLKKVREFEGR
jgi:Transposase and inactivated derivatives